jgi:hypothetical protein
MEPRLSTKASLVALRTEAAEPEMQDRVPSGRRWKLHRAADYGAAMRTDGPLRQVKERHGNLTRAQKRLLVAVVVPIQVILAVLAWRDLAARSDEQVRGKKNVWRVFVVLNPGNSAFYWLLGRRRSPS